MFLILLHSSSLLIKHKICETFFCMPVCSVLDFFSEPAITWLFFVCLSNAFIASLFKTLLVLYLESLTFVYFPANLSSDYDEVCDPWCQQYWVTVSKLTKDNFQNNVSYQPLSLVQQVDFYSSFVFWLFYFYTQKLIWSVQWLCYGGSSP